MRFGIDEMISIRNEPNGGRQSLFPKMKEGVKVGGVKQGETQTNSPKDLQTQIYMYRPNQTTII